MMTELVRLHGEDLDQPWALLPTGASLGPEGVEVQLRNPKKTATV
jgi:hypothetical protein